MDFIGKMIQNVLFGSKSSRSQKQLTQKDRTSTTVGTVQQENMACTEVFFGCPLCCPLSHKTAGSQLIQSSISSEQTVGFPTMDPCPKSASSHNIRATSISNWAEASANPQRSDAALESPKSSLRNQKDGGNYLL